MSPSPAAVGNEKVAPDNSGNAGAGALGNRRGCCTGDVAGIGSGGIVAGGRWRGEPILRSCHSNIVACSLSADDM